MSILAGDVGGTKIRLGLYTTEGQILKRGKVERFESAKYKSLSDAIAEFLEGENVKISTACFGIPGPVIDGTVKVTNLPWTLSEIELASSLQIPKVKLVNDLVSTAAAIPQFTDDDLLTLHEGKKLGANGVAAVVAPGTGLGQAIISVQNGQIQLIPSEGGHSNFAPSNETEADLYKYMLKKVPHVSVEHVLCGPGLVNIYNFFKDSGLAKESPDLVAEMKAENPSAVITRNAQEGKHEICIKTLDTFVNILGAHCNNLLLTVLGTGGIYLGGGVPPKILKKLSDGTILNSFFSKGRLRAQAESTSLKVIKDDHASLTGAAYIASKL